MGKNNMINEEPDNEVPFGSLEEEVADDIPVMLSEGEYVIPADVVRYWGLKHLEEMRMLAKCGLMSMQQDGRLHMVDEDGEPVETEAQSKPQIEVVEIDIQAMQDGMSKKEDDDTDDMDAQMELFDNVDFDGKDEEEIEEDNVLKMFEGGTPSDADAAAAAGEDAPADDESSGASPSEEAMGGPTSAAEAGPSVGTDAGTSMAGPEGPTVDAVAGNPTGKAGEGIGSPGATLSTGLNVTGLTAPEVAIAAKAEEEGADNPIGTARAATAMGYTGVNQFSTDTPVDTQVDQAINARTALDPTAAQLDINARLEKGFQAANPGVVGVTNALATALSTVSPAIAATLAVGNVINASQGKPGIGTGGLFGLDIAGTIGEKLSGVVSDIVDFSETVPGNIEETMASNVEAGKEVGSSDKEPKKPKALPDINDLLNKTMKIDGIDTDIPVRNSLMSQTLNT
jgi:hypothetical protein